MEIVSDFPYLDDSAHDDSELNIPLKPEICISFQRILDQKLPQILLIGPNTHGSRLNSGFLVAISMVSNL
jgi:hypothetical protein